METKKPEWIQKSFHFLFCSKITKPTTLPKSLFILNITSAYIHLFHHFAQWYLHFFKKQIVFMTLHSSSSKYPKLEQQFHLLRLRKSSSYKIKNRFKWHNTPFSITLTCLVDWLKLMRKIINYENVLMS